MSKNKPYIVVFGTDFSKASERAFRAAFEQAANHDSGQLHVVTATFAVGPEPTVDPTPYAGWGAVPFVSMSEVQENLQRYVTAQVQALGKVATKPEKITLHVAVDVPSTAIVQLASDLEADAIVVGTHGTHGVTRWLLGSVAEGVVRQACCPVLVVPPEPTSLKEPVIEPPCPRCVEARRAGRGEWCQQHSERHGRRHTYHQGERMSADSNFPLVVS
jgi:nucleotide-binding universal stress UspA family protein